MFYARQGKERLFIIFFFSCSFSTECWAQFGIVWNLSLSFENMLTHAKNSYQSSHFLEKVLYVAWNIWKQRNSFIFYNVQPSVASWMTFFKNDLSLLVYHLRLDEISAFCSWINHLYFLYIFSLIKLFNCGSFPYSAFPKKGLLRSLHKSIISIFVNAKFWCYKVLRVGCIWFEALTNVGSVFKSFTRMDTRRMAPGQCGSSWWSIL